MELVPGELLALLLVVSLSEIAADQGIVHVEAGRDLDVLPAPLQVAFADLRKAQTQPGLRVAGVQGVAFSKADFASAILTCVR